MQHETFTAFLHDALRGERHCFVRPPDGVPLWLEACHFAVLHGTAEERAGLAEAALLADSVLAPAHPKVQWTERPSHLFSLALDHMRLGAGVPEGLIPEPTAGTEADVVAWRGKWLREAAGGLEEAEPQQRWRVAATQRRCRLPVLLAGNGMGVVAVLELGLVRQRHAGLRFVPAPRSAVTPIDQDFQQSLDDATHLLQTLVGPGPDFDPEHTALTWDLAPRTRAMGGVSGNSAGAAVALGALWLLRDGLDRQQSPLRKGLMAIDAGTLLRVAITARLLGDGCLGHVRDVAAKAKSLRELAAALGPEQPLTLHLALGQPVEPDDPLVDDTDSTLPRPESREHADIQSVVTAISDRCSSMDESQSRLHEALLAFDLEDALDSSPQVDDELIGRVLDRPASCLAHYLLERWAGWAAEQEGQLRLRYVPLSVAPEAQGQPGTEPQEFRSLAQLLADRGLMKRRPAAYLLRGEPGGGKTTLLRHHEQALCIRALRDLADGHAPAEVPLYVELSGLPPADTSHNEQGRGRAIADWLRRQVKATFKQVTELHALLDGSAAHGTTRLRLLVDGLNELQVPPRSDRKDRAREVFHALRRLCGDHPLPMLMVTRTHHPFELLDPKLKVLQVDVLRWDEAQVVDYLKQRFRSQPEAAERHVKDLLSNKTALELCRVPMHLDGQCELLEQPGAVLYQDRASLYTAWLWQRLWRGIQRPGGQPLHPALHNDRLGLLSREDRDRIEERRRWLQQPLLDLPCEGLLLPTMFRQAHDQWRQDARAGREASVRCAAKVPEADVARWLDSELPGLRSAWLQAVRDLGLARRTPEGQFVWAHPSWGEFLTSRHLLPGPDPQALPQAEVDALLAALEPPPLARRDVDELDHRRQQVEQAWGAVPSALWERLLSQGICIGFDGLQSWLDQVSGSPQASKDNLDWLRCGAGLVGADSEGNCRVDLKCWASSDTRMNEHGPSWWRSARAWSTLVQSVIWRPFADRVWSELERELGSEQAQLLRASGQLALPSSGDLDEPMVLALQALPDPAGWLRQLYRRPGLLPLAARCVAAVRERLEPDRWTHPHPLLQHVRRLLLLRSVDAGAAVKDRVLASGVGHSLALTKRDNDDGLSAEWESTWKQAFQGHGYDIRHRIQAGLLLGELGDTLRYEKVAGHGGLRLKPWHWIGTGPQVQDCLRSGAAAPKQTFVIGDAHGRENEQPIELELEGFAMAAYPVTVGEWQAFMEDPRCYDPESPWWQAAGQAALGWLQQQPGQGRNRRPWALDQTGFNNPLQPMTSISWFEADAYRRWARTMVEDEAPSRADGPRWKLKMPTEIQWEAGVRGAKSKRWGRWPHEEGSAEPDALSFNHHAAGWRRPSPVGVFSAGSAPHGVADAAGNVWEWCTNIGNERYDKTQGHEAGGPLRTDTEPPVPRSLRGGFYGGTSGFARTGYRNFNDPGYDYYGVGVRLVRVRLPHL